MFVAENLNSDEYPEIVGFKGRVQKHSCFDSRMHSGMRGSASGGFVQAMANKLSETAEGARTSASDMAELIFKNLDNVSKVSNNINQALLIASQMLSIDLIGGDRLKQHQLKSVFKRIRKIYFRSGSTNENSKFLENCKSHESNLRISYFMTHIFTLVTVSVSIGAKIDTM